MEPSVYLSGLGLSHPEPSLIMALVGLALAVSGIVVTYLYYWRRVGLHGMTERNRYAKNGYTFLENKYYLDHLYNDVIVETVKRPIANWANRVNQNVLDRVVDRAGETARDTGRWIYKWIDQGAIDGSVNAAARAADSSGECLRAIQSGKVQNYGQLLFGSAAVLAIVFVIVV